MEDSIPKYQNKLAIISIKNKSISEKYHPPF